MKAFNILITLSLVAVMASCSGQQGANYVGNRAPLHETAFIELPLGSISADGWLLEMLVRQKNGLTGHLDELYPQVMGPRNGWLGGDGDQWERGPYWIDGLLPLAYILKDDELISKTTPWIEWMLSSARPDGYFGPATDYPYEPGLQRDNCADWWPRMVVLKVLQQYYSATSDERVITLMTNYFKYQLENLRQTPLDHWTFWARYRACDNLAAVYWLYNITGDKFLIDLGELIYAQAEPYTEQFLDGDRLSRVGTIHGVNLAQGIKTPIVYWQYDNDEKYLKALDCALDDIRRHQGYPIGMFSVDEAIHGNDPTQGIELCAVVEYMFSLETMYRITGDPKFAELLEKIAFNALPAQTSDDYMTRQYFQQVNQISVAAHTKNFDINHKGTDICFGLLTGYPCCTSNMHQGWPKFVQNLWYATSDGGLAATIYGPSSVIAKVADGVDVVFRETTKYPFETKITLSCESISKPAAFPLVMRVPSWSREWSISVNGEKLSLVPDSRGLVRVSRCWNEGDCLTAEFVPELTMSVWKEASQSVERGPLVFALNIDSRMEKESLNGQEFYEFYPTSDWNYAVNRDITKGFTLDESALAEDIVFPWNEQNAPLSITADAYKVNDWKEYNHQAGPLPYSISYGADIDKTPVSIKLIPYGCTTLRITEFPVVAPYSSDYYEPVEGLIY